jgi:hypothetical protein
MRKMHLRCPYCKDEVPTEHWGRRCPHCREKVYFEDRWRWLRGIICGLVALAPMYLFYDFDGTLTLFIEWLALSWVLWFVLSFFLSYRLVPPRLAPAPQDGSIRLNV